MLFNTLCYTRTGGFIVTKKMLDMFKRPDDPPEYYHLYGIPAAGSMAFYTAGSMSGHVPEIDSAAATLAGLLCIGGIGGLSSQTTARMGAASGQAGVTLAVASTLYVTKLFVSIPILPRLTHFLGITYQTSVVLLLDRLELLLLWHQLCT